MNGFYHKASEITNYRGELVFSLLWKRKEARKPEQRSFRFPGLIFIFYGIARAG